MNVSDLLASTSLPGTEPPQRGLFLGRAGALLPLSKPPSLPKIEPALFSGVAVGSLFRAAQAGWNIYLIGNEEGVANGGIADANWTRFETDLLAYLTAQGIPIKRHYACLDHPHGKGKHRRDSVFRFPNTGALYHAAQEDGIDLKQSWIVAHRTCELAAGWRAGCLTAGVGECTEERRADLHVEPQVSGRDLADALALILSADRYARR